MTSEWDNTPWAGSIVPRIKAASGPGVAVWNNDIPLSSWRNTPQSKAAAHLAAYKVGWFNKASRKISEDISGLAVTVAPEDQAGDNESAVVEPDLFTPFERLDPIGKFLRLMERPNPHETGRRLRAKTQIRIDMAGTAFWWMENGELGGLPTAIYGISPSRMWPSYGSDGKIMGWVLDRDKPGGGMPFDASAILVFATANPEDGSPFGIGVVEAVESELPLTDLMARHTTDLLTTGGRLAGMLWPKNRGLDENEFQDAQRAWRNVASDPNAARRLLLFPEPMEWAPGASTPAQIGIPELATLTRDNILSAFPIDPTMLGVPMPSGLNASGETRREIKMAYWSETIHPRVELLEETIQIGLLSRVEAMVGGTLDFEIAEPNMDTASTLIEKVAALKALQETGFDDKAAIDAAGLDHIKWIGKPAPPPQLAAFTGDPGVTAAVTEPKGVPKVGEAVVKAAPDRLAPLTRSGKNVLTRFLDGQKRRVIDHIRAAAPAKGRLKADGDYWPDGEDEELRKAIRALYIEVGKSGLQLVADTLGRIVSSKQVQGILDDLQAYGGDRIVGINAVTREAVTREVSEGVRRGYSLTQIIEGVSDEGYKGVLDVGLDNGTAAWSELRAETIARTETMLSYNRAQVTSYGSFGVQELVAYDGDGDDECANRVANNPYTIDEAMGIEDHPNGTLVWSPVVDKSVDHGYELALKAIEAFGSREQPVVHIHNEPPSVDLPPVYVTTGETYVSPPAVTVNVPEPAKASRRIERDDNGAIVRVVEE